MYQNAHDRLQRYNNYHKKTYDNNRAVLDLSVEDYCFLTPVYNEMTKKLLLPLESAYLVVKVHYQDDT